MARLEDQLASTQPSLECLPLQRLDERHTISGASWWSLVAPREEFTWLAHMADMAGTAVRASKRDAAIS
jgi:hypothetical protein